MTSYIVGAVFAIGRSVRVSSSQFESGQVGSGRIGSIRFGFFCKNDKKNLFHLETGI